MYLRERPQLWLEHILVNFHHYHMEEDAPYIPNNYAIMSTAKFIPWEEALKDNGGLVEKHLQKEI